MKQKANNTIVDLITTELKDIKSTNADMNEMFKDFMITTQQEKAQKIMRREAKIRRDDERIMMVDTSTMAPEQAAYYEHLKSEIMQRRFGSS